MAIEVAVAEQGAVVTITLNNPPMNQIDAATHADLRAALKRLGADPAVRVLVLTGAGDRAFCAGADIRQLETNFTTPATIAADVAAWDELFELVREFPCPTVAAVNGYALGGGFEILLNTDIRIAADHAVMGCPAATLGLIASIHSLANQVPLPLAKELFFTARRLTAAEALDMGLVNQVVPPAALAAATRKMAGQILRQVPESVRAGKALMHRARTMDRDAHDRLTREAFLKLAQGAGRRERVRAFLEKRQPS